MNHKTGEILYFKEYTFNDTGETRPHFGLVVVPPKLTDFKSSIFCAVITSREPRTSYYVHTLSESNYACFTRDSYVKLNLLDYVHESGLHQGISQPVGKLIPSDILKVIPRIRTFIFSPNSGVDKYLRAAIIREWKKIKPTV